MEMLDFSNFSPESLQAIQKAAHLAKGYNSGKVKPCHLVGGLVSRDALMVCAVLRGKGYDPDATLQSIAEGMSAGTGANTEEGITFSPEVEKIFSKISRESGGTAIVPVHILEELLNPAQSYLTEYLKRDPQSMASRKRQYAEDDASTGPTVKKFCSNMLEMADKGKFSRAIGREEELKRVLLTLARKSKNNPVLVGEAGTGKTSIAEELAYRLLYMEVPEELSKLKLYNLDFSTVKAMPDAVGVMKAIVKEAAEDPNLVLFIDEIHMLISGYDGADNDIANLMKPAMARGDIKVLGATTLDEYRRIEKDPAFERRFQQVTVKEPDEESAVKILINAKKRFEAHHNVTIPDKVCRTAVNLSIRYITNRKLPDKAIDLIDEAAANIRIEGRRDKTMNVNDVKKVVTNWTGIPVDDMDDNENQRLQNLEEELHNSVIGQDKAVKAVADAIKRNRMGFGDASKPIGSFLFLGTTGTGKTELCKALAKFLFKDSSQMVRIDMSEYQQEHSVHRLFGAPPGYVGFEQGGQLTEAVYRKPFSVVLFDEIEKAHPKVFESLLQVLDDGRMTDGKGKVVNFKNTIIVMTSNMGQRNILDRLCGRNPTEEEVERCTVDVMAQLKSKVAPEFLNRIDKVVMFLPLTKDDVTKITALNLDKEKKKLKEKGTDIIYDSSVVKFITDQGYNPEYGGRPIKRAINEYIIDPLTTEIINGNISRNNPVYITSVNNKIIFNNGSASRI